MVLGVSSGQFTRFFNVFQKRSQRGGEHFGNDFAVGGAEGFVCSSPPVNLAESPVAVISLVRSQASQVLQFPQAAGNRFQSGMRQVF